MHAEDGIPSYNNIQFKMSMKLTLMVYIDVKNNGTMNPYQVVSDSTWRRQQVTGESYKMYLQHKHIYPPDFVATGFG